MKASLSTTLRLKSSSSSTVSGSYLRMSTNWVAGDSGSVKTSMSGVSWPGTSICGRSVVCPAAARSCAASPSGGGAKYCLILASISATSKSPTATTAIRSGLYQRS